MAVVLEQTEAPGGLDVSGRALAFDRRGTDRVRFDISTNPGEPLRPLAKVASGGEAARLMLALKSVLGRADPTPTLIFDEVDAGIGGRVGAVVGRKLWQLSRTHQVVCVTHLPQVAAYADRHIHVQKGADAGRTVTALAQLDAAGRAAELSQMLGTVSDVGHASAVELLEEAQAWKSAAPPTAQTAPA
jgi:DNA repair protein RecN (Recombination protein N)